MKVFKCGSLELLPQLPSAQKAPAHLSPFLVYEPHYGAKSAPVPSQENDTPSDRPKSPPNAYHLKILSRPSPFRERPSERPLCSYVGHTRRSQLFGSFSRASQHLLHKNNPQLLAVRWTGHHMPASHLVGTQGAAANAGRGDGEREEDARSTSTDAHWM